MSNLNKKLLTYAFFYFSYSFFFPPYSLILISSFSLHAHTPLFFSLLPSPLLWAAGLELPSRAPTPTPASSSGVGPRLKLRRPASSVPP